MLRLLLEGCNLVFKVKLQVKGALLENGAHSVESRDTVRQMSFGVSADTSERLPLLDLISQSFSLWQWFK